MAAEVGLGVVSDVMGSTDANIVQLRTILKYSGRKLALSRQWTQLINEFSFQTYQKWQANTVYTSAANTWAGLTSYNINDKVFYALDGVTNLYQCTVAGTSAAAIGPIFTSGTGTDGSVTWKWLNSGRADIVSNGLYYYTCTTGGTSGTVGPTRTTGTNSDGASVVWTWTGRAADFALPAGFNSMIDQTGWNRTNRLPLGGPISAQEWQYLKGRLMGVVFNVLFRPLDGIMRIYPDTNPPAGYNIVFEYLTSYWVGLAGSTTPSTDTPINNSDLIYFDSMLMNRKLKLDFLKAKGFDTSHAQQAYDEALEAVKNADAPSPVLNLRGRSPYDPLLGPQNIPITGYG